MLSGGHPSCFSYRKRWIAQELLGQGKTLRGRKAIITFFEQPEEAGGEMAFLPLRFATILGFEPRELIGTSDPEVFLTLRFELGDFVRPSVPIAEQRALWQGWAQSLEDRPRPREHADSEMSKMVFQGKPFPAQADVSEDVAWLRLAEQLSEARTMQGCSLYRVKRVHGPMRRFFSGGELKGQDRQGLVVRKMRAAKTYRIDLQQFVSHTSTTSPKTLSTTVTAPSIKLSQPITDSVGLGTESTIIAQCGRVYAPEVGTLVVEDPKDEKYETARTAFVVHLRPARWLLVVVVLLLALGSFAGNVNADWLKDLSSEDTLLQQRYPNLAEWVNGNGSTAEGILKTAGAFLVGLGAYLGFKQVPSS